MLEKIFGTKKRPANPIWAIVAQCPDRSKTGGAGNSAFIKGLYRNYRLCCLEAKSDFSPQPECCCDALGGKQMDPNFKDSARDSAIKRLVCYTVWHSSFNGFMAVQTQLGRFQNGTHLFFLLFLWDCGLDKRPERKWSVLLDSPRRGRAGLTVIWRDPLFLPGNLPPLAPLPGLPKGKGSNKVNS